MHQVIKSNISSIIKDKLQKNLKVIFLDLQDDSHLHIGHNDQAKQGNTHFSLTVAAKEFENINLLSRHKMINDILKQELEIIHALRIKAYTGKEYLNKYDMQKACLQNEDI
jgi:BolA protein